MPRAKKTQSKKVVEPVVLTEATEETVVETPTKAPAKKKAPAKRKAPAKKAEAPVVDLEAIKKELREEMLATVKQTVLEQVPAPTEVEQTPIDIDALKAELREEIFADLEAQLPTTTDVLDSIDAPTVNTDEVRDQIKREISAEVEGRMQVALDGIERAKTQSRDKMVLKGVGKNTYSIDPTEDGLEFKKADETLFIVGRNGQLATGTLAPRSYGKGSAHFKAGMPSEGIIPTNGDGATRGIIVEGDGDDEKSFVFRAISRMNRRGTNIFSDGSVALGSMDKINDSTLGVYHRFNDKPALGLYAPSKTLENTTLVDIKTGAVNGGPWSAITVTSDVADDDVEKKLFEVASDGSTLSAGSFVSNATGYAELFEWEDRNHRSQNRSGFTVTMTETGKVRIAGEGDEVFGVVVNQAAIVGNAQWNEWKNKYVRDDNGNAKQYPYTVTEWLEVGTSTLHSYFTDSIGQLALPESAVETQTTAGGSDLTRTQVSSMMSQGDKDIYVGRHKRAEWALVCMLGTVPVFKGQEKCSSWKKLRDINDELELLFLK